MLNVFQQKKSVNNGCQITETKKKQSTKKCVVIKKEHKNKETENKFFSVMKQIIFLCAFLSLKKLSE